MTTLQFEVRHPFNGGTDYDVLGAFPTRAAATNYAELCAFKYSNLYEIGQSTYSCPIVVDIYEYQRLEALERMEDIMHNGGPAMTVAEIEELESLR